MKKNLTFCDVCGAPMSTEYSDGDPLEVGLRLDVILRDGSGAGKEVNEHAWELRLKNDKKTNCGSSGQAGFMNSKDFCSERCLTQRLNRFLYEAGVQLKVVSSSTLKAVESKDS